MTIGSLILHNGSMPPEHVIEVSSVSKRFTETDAVKNVSFTVSAGDIFALVGPNGAGKTTLLKMIVGLLQPDSGNIYVGGYDIVCMPVAAKKCFGYVSDDPSAYDYLTGIEFLSLTGRLRGMNQSDIHARIKELSELFPIKDILKKSMSGYSRGNKQKTAFLAALMSEPKVLIIDEPVVGLDPYSMKIFGRTLKIYAKKGHAVLFVTHILEFAREYATRAAVMQEGKITQTGNAKIVESVDTLS